ncbi:hypothetical protein PAPYR_9041 [Paratrimastix pyriformis]|uniref:Uncharacterized protein n=1 Tax=Paratrimastix pyriformis TaxID=342808 RepID=A0ABQ8UE28_9EUKA|nr:hypothetical protein PAPYR_9041 [Paratrimastix pyriformis]
MMGGIWQCTLDDDAPDHSHAAFFLKRFVGQVPSWLLADLSSASCGYGLGGIASDQTSSPSAGSPSSGAGSLPARAFQDPIIWCGKGPGPGIDDGSHRRLGLTEGGASGRATRPFDGFYKTSPKFAKFLLVEQKFIEDLIDRVTGAKSKWLLPRFTNKTPPITGIGKQH